HNTSCVTLSFSSFFYFLFFFFNAPAPTAISTLSLHDALPISALQHCSLNRTTAAGRDGRVLLAQIRIEFPFQRETTDNSVNVSLDRKSTRLNSSHQIISYAVFCLKKKNKNIITHLTTNTKK